MSVVWVGTADRVRSPVFFIAQLLAGSGGWTHMIPYELDLFSRHPDALNAVSHESHQTDDFVSK